MVFLLLDENEDASYVRCKPPYGANHVKGQSARTSHSSTSRQLGKIRPRTFFERNSVNLNPLAFSI